MTKLVRIALTPLAVLALASACKNAEDAKPESRQVELAPAPAAQPQLADTAAVPAMPAAPAEKPAPKSPSPKPASAAQPAPATTPAPSAAPAAPATSAAPARAAAPAMGTVAAGAAIGVASTARVCTNTAKVGDKVTATVSAVARGSNGVEVPTGATMTLKVTEAVRGENGKEGIRLAFAPVSVTIGDVIYDVAGTASHGDLETVAAQTKGDQAKKVATGAVIGAIAGKLIGKKNKDAVIGGVVGAAAGGAIAAGTTDWNGCLPQGGRVNVTLSQPLTIKKTP
jgi:hypothetical protein